jgi:cellulose synthase/poly-beta-1,6-N-acetylglucosamine synthase-like glycosyltransferase
MLLPFFEIVLWSSVAVLAYVHVGYPLLARALAALAPRPVRKARIVPRVSVLVVAWNEAARIADRLENLLESDYPPERMEILVGSDGSTDGTAGRATLVRGGSIRVYAFPQRRGKPAVLNDLAARARGEILVLADCRQRFEPETIRALVRPFADPEVGAVSGELLLDEPGGGAIGRGVGLYWRYEKFIRKSESAFDSTVGATGAVYALRRALHEPIPEDTILDDVLIPMNVARRGFRVILEPAARAHDRAASSEREEWVRKVRTIAGNLQLLGRHRWLLSPARNRLWVQTISHKALRLLIPLLFAAALAANAALVGRPFYDALLAGQALFHASGLLPRLLPVRPRGLARALAVPRTFLLLTAATTAAWLRFLRQDLSATWERGIPAARPLPAAAELRGRRQRSAT